METGRLLGPYELDTIVCGDCLDVMRQMPDGCVDMIYADMLYDNFDLSWLDGCHKVLSQTGSIYVQTDCRSVAQVKIYMDALFEFKSWIVWCYKACPTRKRYYQRKHDDILYYTKSDKYTWNMPTQKPSPLSLARFRTDEEGKILNPSPAMQKTGIRYVRDVVCRDWWDDIPVPSGFSPWSTGKKIHRWQKPVLLLERIIGASSNLGDLVFDPFMGSGTTAVAAKKLGRRYFGCDISPEYVDMANKRLAKVDGIQLSLLPE